MKRVNLWILGLIATFAVGATFTACSSDDEQVFAKPNVTVTGEGNAQIDLRDATIFNLPVNITSEAGLASIQVKDKSNSANVWNFTSFANPNNVESVTLDLSNITVNTQMNLEIVATDNSGQTTTASYILSISGTEVEISASGTSTLGNNAIINVTLKRGLKPLDKIVATLNGETTSEIEVTDPTAKESIQAIDVNDLSSGENTLKLDLYEEGNTAVSSTITVTVTSSASFLGMELNNGLLEFGDWGYDEDSKTQMIQFVQYDPEAYDPEYGGEPLAVWLWTLTFDDNKQVTQITQEDYYTMMEPTITYNFSYEGNKLTSVTKDDEPFVTNVVYEGNDIKTFTVDGQTREAKYADANGRHTRVDYLDAENSGKSFGFTGNEYLNPYYIEGLPAVIPGLVAGIPLQILYSKYLFNSIGSWTTGWQEGVKEAEDGDTASTLNATIGDWTFELIYH